MTMYTDSRCVFVIVHVHGALSKEMRLLTPPRKEMKNTDEILAPMGPLQNLVTLSKAKLLQWPNYTQEAIKWI